MDIKTFIYKANEKHFGKYDYSNIDQISVTHKDKVKIICPTHGEFTQNVNSHLLRSGCPTCGKQKNIRSRMKPKTLYIDKAVKVHGNKYDYTLIPSTPKATDKVEIICPTHGVFKQQLNDHVRGHGCNLCAREQTGYQISKGLDHFIGRCQQIHGDVYDYSYLPIDAKIKDTVNIVCKKHGSFSQVLDCHLAGSGCPKCAQSNHASRPEKEIQEWLSKHNVVYETNVRSIISPKELDIWIPSHSTAIEFCGLYWHSETQGKTKQYHRNKMIRCQEKEIRLITIFEDEWLYRQDQVKRKLLSILGKSQETKLFARQCKITLVSTDEKRSFFETNHIQGDGLSSINVGLRDPSSELVAVMSFSVHKDNIYYLTRYATSARVIGGFSKLLKHFQHNFTWAQIISFADLRWSTGNLYHTTGWVLDKVLPPDYSYIRGTKRFHKFNYRRKNLPRLLVNFDPNISEKQNCDNAGILRIWDCGKQRWVLNNS